MIVGLVLLLVAIMIWVLGSLPWLILNYLICFPEASIGCADPAGFANTAQYIVLFNVLLVVFAGFTIAHLRRLHSRYRRRQQLTNAVSRQRLK